MLRSANPELLGRRPKVFLACSGLGTIQRGYESFIRDFFDVLSAEGSLDVRLFKGAGPKQPGEVALTHLPRAGFPARALGQLSGRGPYVVEQTTFAAGLIPHIVREQPDVIVFPDPAVGKLLWAWRRLFGGRYRLVLHNAGPIAPPFPYFDHVHQVTPMAVADAIAAGHDPARQTLIPSGVHFGSPPVTLSPEARGALRRRLNLPADRPIVLSVGALNRGHKRMDYVIDEIASLPQPRPFLVLLGQEESDTPAVRATAELRLGREGCLIGQVNRDEVARHYQAADLFVLASLREGFGLVLVEALAHGLPTITHDHAVARYVMEGEGRLADVRAPGALAAEVQAALAVHDTEAARVRRYESVRQRFGWIELAPHYVAMLAGCAPMAAMNGVAEQNGGLMAQAGAPPAEA